MTTENPSKEYTAAFFIVPSSVMNLPNLSISFLKFFETIFQFWNHDKQCFLSNEAIMKRTGIKSRSTIDLAFKYFEKHGEMERIFEGSKRYIVQKILKVEFESVDNSNQNSTNIVIPLDASSAPTRCIETLPLDASRHNTNNINTKNLIKSFYENQKSKNEQKPAWAAMKNEKAHIERNKEFKKAVIPEEIKEIAIANKLPDQKDNSQQQEAVRILGKKLDRDVNNFKERE